MHLKKFDKVILLVNLDIQNGLVNGTQLLILETHEEFIYCKILNGPFKNNKVIIGKTKLLIKMPTMPFQFFRI